MRSALATLPGRARTAWRRSLQLRVVTSTVALSSAVVLALGVVLQSQIAERLIDAKVAAALVQARNSQTVVELELRTVDPSTVALTRRLTSALDRLTSPGAGGVVASAGAFEPVLADGGSPRGAPGTGGSVGPLREVPAPLRERVQSGRLAYQITTVQRDGAVVPMLAVGTPVDSAGRDLQLYLLFPLASEQRTLDLVRSTLVVGGLVLLVLIAGIASLVTRQVVVPVRRAAQVAGRFAAGDLDERIPVRGADDTARLGTSFNQMAASIQEQIRQLEEFGALQRGFTSDVSHELRTPLTTVRMAADVLHDRRTDLPAGLDRSAELLVTELDRFEALLADLLEISRLDSGVAQLQAETTDVSDTVRAAAGSVRALARRAGSTVELDLPENGELAEIDPRRVERILRNLMANAADHGEGKPVRVVLRGDDDAVAVLVRDQGVGLRAGEAERVFTRFWRADPSRSRCTGGTGLGLSIALEDTKLHGGWLQAWGEPGRGAAFRLTLPRQPGHTLVSSPCGAEADGCLPGVARADR